MLSNAYLPKINCPFFWYLWETCDKTIYIVHKYRNCCEQMKLCYLYIDERCQLYWLATTTFHRIHGDTVKIYVGNRQLYRERVMQCRIVSGWRSWYNIVRPSFRFPTPCLDLLSGTDFPIQKHSQEGEGGEKTKYLEIHVPYVTAACRSLSPFVPMLCVYMCMCVCVCECCVWV